MYNSPIELLVTDIQSQIVKQHDEEICRAVLHYVPNVDKEELLRALKYDRDQYEKGYLDGKADAVASIVRCKDCKHCITDQNIIGGYGDCLRFDPVNKNSIVQADDFCSYGERKDNDG